MSDQRFTQIAAAAGLVIVLAVGFYLGSVSIAAHGSVFDVTDEDRGLHRMHHELVKEQS